MPRAGQRIDLFGQVAPEASGLRKVEQVGPARSELRNGRYTEAGAWRRRPGLDLLTTNPSGSGAAGAIPHQGGLIVCRNGSVWRLNTDLTQPPQELPGRIEGNAPLSWDVFDNAPVAVRGGAPVVIDETGVRRLGLREISRPSAPTITIEAKGGLVPPGEYEYFVTWTTTQGETRPSAASAASVPITLGDGDLGRTVTVTRPSLPSDEKDRARVRTWRIYRRWGTGALPQLVKELERDQLYYDDVSPWGALPELFHDMADSTEAKPPASHSITVSRSRVLVTEGSTFHWSDDGSMDLWYFSSYSSVAPGSGQIRAARAVDGDVYFFCDNALEVWANTGGQTPFQHRITIPRGCGSGASAILAGGAIPVWLGDDKHLYAYSGGQVQDVSGFQVDALREISRPGEIRVVEYRHEKVLAFWSPFEKHAFIYDYARNNLSRDSTWDGNSWQHPKAGAYMELRGNRIAAAHASTGEIWRVSEDAADDDGDMIRVINRLTTPLAPYGARGRANQLRLRAQRGQSANATDVVVRWGHDQGPLAASVKFPLGAIGSTNPHFSITNLGLAYELTIEIEHPGTADFLLTSGYLVTKALGESNYRGE